MRGKALQLGWTEASVRVLDRDLGLSGAHSAAREDFKTLVAEVSMGQVGAVFALEVSRLARSNVDWHRLLEFVEVPTRTNRNLGIGSPGDIPRVPGRMNLNTSRFADNFAALLDDSRNVTFKIDGTDMAGAAFHQVDADAGELYDQFQGTNRDWWDQFLKSRDPIDPYWASTVSVPLPGLPGSLLLLQYLLS